MSLKVSDKSKADRIDVRAEGNWWTNLAGKGSIYGAANAPTYKDVCQGQMGNCWFLSSLLAIALKKQGPQFLADRLLDNSDEWVFCTLWDGAKREHLMKAKKQHAKQASLDASGKVIGKAATTESSALWVSMFQVFASAFTCFKTNVADVVYDAKNPSLTRLNSGYPHVGLAILTGRDTQYGDMTGAWNVLQSKATAGNPIVLNSKKASDLQAMYPGHGTSALNHIVVEGLVGGHAYAVWDVGNHQFGPVGPTNPPVKALRLVNPWGRVTRDYVAADGFLPDDVVGQGDFWMPWDDVEDHFSHYFYSEQDLGGPLT